MRVVVGVATDIGRVRERNEDSYLVEPPLYAVADGMGGARGGAVASSLALDTLEEVFRSGKASLADHDPLRQPRGVRTVDLGPQGLRDGHHAHRRPRSTSKARTSATSATAAHTCSEPAPSAN